MNLFETERLAFRHLETQDLDALAEMYADPEVRRFYPDGTRTRQETLEEIKWFAKGHPRHPQLGLWAAVRKSDGRLVGRSGLLPWHLDGVDEVEVAYLIGREFWGQGLGTESAQGVLRYAREKLGFRRLISLIDEQNTASIRVALKIGMRFERKGRDEIGPFQLYSIEDL